MTRLIHIFSAWLNAVRDFIERNPYCFILLFLVGLTLLATYIIRYLYPDLDPDLELFLYLTLVILAFFTIYVTWLTQDATKDERDANAKVGRLWFDFALVVVFGLVVVAIQFDLQKKIADRSHYINAVSQLGSPSPAARKSGIDYLNKTCIEKEESHPDICNKYDTIELLSNHVRFFTHSKSYREDFTEEPSGDIARIIEILKKRQEPINIIWDGAYLRGANLSRAKFLQGAFLNEANLQGANLDDANLQGADLRNTNLQGADLYDTNLQGANLRKANLQGADLGEANLQEADLYETNLQGAHLRQAKLQGAFLNEANLQGANLWYANLQGAHLRQAKLQGAYSEYEVSPADFCTRINSRIGKPTEIEEENVVFSGGITEELWEEMNKTQWHNEEVRKYFLSKMKSHLRKKPIYTIPDEFKKEMNIGTLTKETVTAIIEEYNESLTDKQLRCELP